VVAVAEVEQHVTHVLVEMQVVTTVVQVLVEEVQIILELMHPLQIEELVVVAAQDLEIVVVEMDLQVW
jgi:hypothetical protein